MTHMLVPLQYNIDHYPQQVFPLMLQPQYFELCCNRNQRCCTQTLSKANIYSPNTNSVTFDSVERLACGSGPCTAGQRCSGCLQRLNGSINATKKVQRCQRTGGSQQLYL